MHDAGGETPEPELVIAEVVERWRHQAGAAVLGAVFFAACTVVLPGALKWLGLGLVASATGALALSLSRLLRRGPQLFADSDGVRCKVWRGHRTLDWADITAIEAVRRIQPMNNTVELGRNWRMPVVPRRMVRATGHDDRGFLVRFGPRLLQACYVYETLPAKRFAEDRHTLVDMWRHAVETG